MSDEKKVTMDIKIPATAFITCPLNWEWKVVSVKKKCCKCKYFDGLYALNNIGHDLPFRKQFSVNCVHPTMRDIIEVEL